LLCFTCCTTGKAKQVLKAIYLCRDGDEVLAVSVDDAKQLLLQSFAVQHKLVLQALETEAHSAVLRDKRYLGV
jgi:hypothetical protein